MQITVKQSSSLEKIRTFDSLPNKEITCKKVFGGERFCYQIAVKNEEPSLVTLNVSVVSQLMPYIKVYQVVQSVMDFPTYPFSEDEDYITKEPGLMPDMLLPLHERNNLLTVGGGMCSSLWITVDIPRNFESGSYDITVKLSGMKTMPNITADFSDIHTMSVKVLPASLPTQELVCTQWFHTDCIVQAHGVEVYSEAHWNLIDKYIAAASYTGINMLLMPVITPPLDTAYQTERTNVQLTKITLKDGTYQFDFSNVKRWIALCKKHNIQYFEICHLFSQWGAAFAPNIYAETEKGTERIFGWDVSSDAPSYITFLQTFIPELISVLKEESIADKTYFHISDEPSMEQLDAYKKALSIIKPLIKGFKTFDALSDIEFYRQGLVHCPVTASDHIEPFLQESPQEQWVYYCCAQHEKVSNRFLSMPSYRNRIMGLQMYLHNIKGFLQWGFNFYNSSYSVFPVQAYINSSAGGAFPSGDSFSVYPGKEGPYLSLRALVFHDGLQDIDVCHMLEEYIGRDAVMNIIEKQAEMPITFKDYPRNSDFLLMLREKITDEIEKYLPKTEASSN